jgi:ketosteroid isomerase-like protein
MLTECFDVVCTKAAREVIRGAKPAMIKALLRRSVEPSAGDGATIAALYAEDAVVSAPNKPAVRGSASIREFYVKDAADFASTGSTATQGSSSDVGVSGDLAWQSEPIR